MPMSKYRFYNIQLSKEMLQCNTFKYVEIHFGYPSIDTHCGQHCVYQYVNRVIASGRLKV